jgi:hypothetical protein
MKKIVKYIADDGIEFNSIDDCNAHEHSCKTAILIMKDLSDIPKGCDFANGSGYIKHDCKKVQSVRNIFLKFCMQYTDHNSIQGLIDGTTHISHANRYLSEVLPNSILKHWARFNCIDKDGLEWGQPYYAIHPEDAKWKQLN